MSTEPPIDPVIQKEAGIRCFEILTSVLEEHEDVYVSLACTGRLLVHGANPVAEEVKKMVEEWKTKPKEEIMDLVDLLPPNAFVALARIEPIAAFQMVERQMAISALVTTHAFFESVMMDLLRVTMLCAPEQWSASVQDKSIPFSEVAAKGLEQCERDLYEKELSKLSMAGMPALVSRLLSFCKGNVTTKSHFQNYVLDMERLKKLDKLRHNYAHRRIKVHYPMKEAEKDLRYLTITGVHLVTCIMDAYELNGQHREAGTRTGQA